MARDRNSSGTPPEAVTSIIGLGMKIIGDCETEASVRVDGTVEGSIKAAKAVVIGKGRCCDRKRGHAGGGRSGQSLWYSERRIPSRASGHVPGRG